MRAAIKEELIGHGEGLAGKRSHGRALAAVLLFWWGAPFLMATQAATTTTLALTANGLSVSSVDAGVAITLSATVETGGKAVALGQVNFCDASAKLCSDIHLLGTVQLSGSGKAALKFVPRAGTHSYKAEFIGTTNDSASVSTDLSLVVYGATTTTIAQTGGAGNYTLKATVTGQANDVAPAGNVEFRDTSAGNAVLATATLGTGISALTWVNTQNPATMPQPLSIAVGYFNGDGIPDLAIGTNGTTTGSLNILLGNGNGTFQAAKTFAGLPNNQAMVAARFVTGGSLDILTVDNNLSGTKNAALFTGNGVGGGTLGTPFSLGGIASVNGIAAGDLNRDGNEDFVVTGIIYGIWCFANVNGNGNGTFGGPTLNAVGDNPLAVVVGPFNTNGYPDIVVADSGADNVTVFQNNSQGYFFPGSVSYSTGTTPVAMATGDFNGDGYLDLAVVNRGSNNVSIFLGKGNETLTAGATLATGHSPTSIAVGDFNGDSIADLAVVNSGDKTVSILLGKGDGTFVAGAPLATGINPVNVATGDFSGTGFSNLAVTNQDIASTTGSVLTVQAAHLTEAATATATKVDPLGTGAHLVDAEYVGDSLYNTSVSATTSLNGMPSPAASPVLTPAAGMYTSARTVTIADKTYNAVIYYTTNGTTPTTASTKYTAGIVVKASETIKAIAIATGFSTSAIATAKYTIALPAATPVFSVAAGNYNAAQSVQISDTTPGATIYYTTNGATPTPASSVYKSAVAISETGYLQAIAVASGNSASKIASALYSIGSDVTATPVLSPLPGAYGSAQMVTMKDNTAGAVITYSVGIGSVVHSYTYTGPFTVSSTEYIAYDAIAPGYTRSASLEGVYTIGTLPTPQFSPAAGSYSGAQTVNLYDVTPSATIYYTTDGTAPTTASAIYTGPLIVTTNETIRAIAAAPGLASSAAASSAYTIGKVVATPTFLLAPGSYTAAQSVGIADITPGATIYYTVNGTAPTTASTKYTGPVAVASSETIKAIAAATGDTNSAIGTAAYTIGYPIETFVATPSGTNLLTIPVGGSAAFAVASENQSGQNISSVTVKGATGSNSSLPVQITLCQTNPSTGQCLAAPGATVTVSPFAPGATPSFSVFVTATSAIASSPNNQVFVLFIGPGGAIDGSASVAVVTH